MKNRTIIVWIIAGLANAGLLLYALFQYLNPSVPPSGNAAEDSVTLSTMQTTVLYYMVSCIWNIFQLMATALIFSMRNPDRNIPMLNLGLALMMLPLVGTVAYFVGGAVLSVGACFIVCLSSYREMKTRTMEKELPVVEENEKGSN